MRVVIVTESFPPDVNGVAHCPLQTARHLVARGHEPLVIAPAAAGTTSSTVSADPTYTDAPCPVVRGPSLPLPGYPQVRVALPSRRLAAALTGHRAELVHLAGPFVLGVRGMAVATRLGLPAVAVHQTDLAGYARTYLGTGEYAAWRRLPAPLHHPLARRQRAVNAVVHALSAHYDAVHLHAADRTWVQDRSLWSVDRLHPAERGHRKLAGKFHRLLADRGLALGVPPGPDPQQPPPTRAAAARWLVTEGTGWLARRSTDLLPRLLGLAAAEIRHRVGGTSGQLDARAEQTLLEALADITHAPSLPVVVPRARMEG